MLYPCEMCLIYRLTATAGTWFCQSFLRSPCLIFIHTIDFITAGVKNKLKFREVLYWMS